MTRCVKVLVAMSLGIALSIGAAPADAFPIVGDGDPPQAVFCRPGQGHGHAYGRARRWPCLVEWPGRRLR